MTHKFDEINRVLKSNKVKAIYRNQKAGIPVTKIQASSKTQVEKLIADLSQKGFDTGVDKVQISVSTGRDKAITECDRITVRKADSSLHCIVVVPKPAGPKAFPPPKGPRPEKKPKKKKYNKKWSS